MVQLPANVVATAGTVQRAHHDHRPLQAFRLVDGGDQYAAGGEGGLRRPPVA